MILRIIAAVTLLAGIAAFIAFLHEMGLSPTASPAARHLRAMKNRTAPPPAMMPASFDAIAALPRDQRYPRYAALESRAVSLEGYVQRMLRAADGDFHLELVPVARMPDDGNLRYVTAEITPQWQRGSARWSYAPLVDLFRPTFGGVTPWERGTRRVRLTGWLCYDYEYEGAAMYGRPRLSSWELHPVTRIERWNDTLSTWEDYPR